MVLLGLWLAGCSQGNFRQLEGEWTSKDKEGRETRLIFGPGARFRALDIKGQKADGTYFEDFRQNPAWLDLKFGEGGIVQTIVRLDGDTLEIQDVKEPNQPRPTKFDNAVTYTKAAPIMLFPSPSPRKRR